jgi:hypothetical protein
LAVHALVLAVLIRENQITGFSNWSSANEIARPGADQPVSRIEGEMNRNTFYCLILIAGLAWLLSGCAGAPAAAVETAAPALPSATLPPPTETTLPTATQTPAPTETPEPTKTPQPTITRTPLPDLKATLNFRATQTAEASIAEINKELEAVGVSPETGHLLWAQDGSDTIDLDQWQQWIYQPFAEDLTASDFVLKTDITWESSGGLVTCGLFFRSEENMDVGKQYYFEMTRLSGLPAWAISFLNYGEFQKSISKVRTNSAIKQDPGSTNKVVLIAEGEKFTLYINDVRIGSFYDYSKSMLEGRFAYSAWQESGKSSCTFSDTWVWALK